MSLPDNILLRLTSCGRLLDVDAVGLLVSNVMVSPILPQRSSVLSRL